MGVYVTLLISVQHGSAISFACDVSYNQLVDIIDGVP